jgi:hypothetical protein
LFLQAILEKKGQKACQDCQAHMVQRVRGGHRDFQDKEDFKE